MGSGGADLQEEAGACGLGRGSVLCTHRACAEDAGLSTSGNLLLDADAPGRSQHFGIRSGSVTSEVRKSHEPARASLPVSARGGEMGGRC